MTLSSPSVEHVSNSDCAGWVPLHILEKGTERADPLPIELISQSKLLGQGATQGAQSKNILHETIRCFWRHIKSKESVIAEAMPAMSERSKKVLFRSSAIHYADYLYDCKFIVLTL